MSRSGCFVLALSCSTGNLTLSKGSSLITVPTPHPHYRVRRPAQLVPPPAGLLTGNPPESPVRVAILPSRLTAAFMLTNGKPVVIYLKNTSFNRRASSAKTPVVTSDPCFPPVPLSPAPLTLGFRSVTATTTRVIPAAIKWLVQGGFRPKWQQGSRFT